MKAIVLVITEKEIPGLAGEMREFINERIDGFLDSSENKPVKHEYFCGQWVNPEKNMAVTIYRNEEGYKMVYYKNCEQAFSVPLVKYSDCFEYDHPDFSGRYVELIDGGKILSVGILGHFRRNDYMPFPDIEHIEGVIIPETDTKE